MLPLSKVADQSDDTNGQVLHRLLSLYPAPDFVKKASPEDLGCSGEELPSSCYADPYLRKFPLHTKSACWLSLAHLQESGLDPADYGPVAEKLAAAATYFGIGPEAAGFLKEANFDTHVSKIPVEYAFSRKDATGKLVERYPLRNQDEVQKAAAYLEQHRDSFSYADRVMMARNITAKVASHELALPAEQESLLERLTGVGLCPASAASGYIRKVATALSAHDDAIAGDLQKAAAYVSGENMLQGELGALCQAIGEASDLYGLGLYPEDVLHGVTAKGAAVFLDGHCSTQTGRVYKTADFSRLSQDAVRDVFGDELADEVAAAGLLVSPEKMARVVTTLPRPDMVLMDRLLNEHGVAAVVEYAKESCWMTPEVLQELAAAT